MKIGSKLQFEVPDDCPTNCRYTGAFEKYGQGSICFRCPVFNCASKGIEGYIIPPEHYREDWLAEWIEFFETGKEPELLLLKTKVEISNATNDKM